MLITGAGSAGHRRELLLGHFAASRWELGEQETLGEIFIGGEGLARGPEMVLGTLLHGAAHALGAPRALKDTSRQGRYHNKRFKTLTHELGLQVEHHPALGWSLTTLSDEAALGYGEAIAALGRALSVHRQREQQGGDQLFPIQNADRGQPTGAGPSPPVESRLR